jgi:hypothetical protein
VIIFAEKSTAAVRISCLHSYSQEITGAAHSRQTKTNKAKQKTLMQSNMNFGDVETATSLPREKIFTLNYLISLQSSLLCNDAELIHQLFLAADS